MYVASQDHVRLLRMLQWSRKRKCHFNVLYITNQYKLKHLFQNPAGHDILSGILTRILATKLQVYGKSNNSF